MKQISNKTICYYCLGCLRLQNEEFNGVSNCKNFVSADADWHEKITKELKQ